MHDDPGLPPVDSYDVTEWESDDPHWMFEMLSNVAFARVDAGHYPELLAAFQAVPVRAGDRVIEQGARGEYFYVVRRGRAQVSRKGAGGREFVLATVGPGACFGEEALLSGEPRNADVTMLEAGVLMRLDAAAFAALLRAPMLHAVSGDQLQALTAQGAQLIDVRPEERFRLGSVAGARNLPLYLLRIKLSEIDSGSPVVTLCDDGRFSATAAFLMVQRGFDARVLQGGLKSLTRRHETRASE